MSRDANIVRIALRFETARDVNTVDLHKEIHDIISLHYDGKLTRLEINKF